jgi:hypothetical protein
MAEAGWLATNAGRSFPLQAPVPTLVRASDSAVITLPTEALVDFTAVVYPAGVLAGATPRLVAVARAAGGSFSFTIACGSLPNLVFAGIDPAAEWLDVAALAHVTTDCGTAPAWSGTLTIGALSRLAALLAHGDSLAGSCPLEPATVADLSVLGVTSLNLANLDRVRVPGPGGIGIALSARAIHVAARCLAGPLWLWGGSDVGVAQNARTNTLTLTAAVGAGEGEPCGEVPFYPGEVPPDYSPFLDGSPACNQLITAISGVAGPVVELAGSGGITAIPDPVRPATLVVAYNPGATGGCPEYVNSSSGLSEASSLSSGSSEG